MDTSVASSSDTTSVISQDWEDYESQASYHSGYAPPDKQKQKPSNILVLNRTKQIGTCNASTKRGLPRVKGIYKNYRVKVYTTPNYPNSIIRNAITGTAFKFNNGDYARVGTYDEDLFFSVLLATGEAGQTAALLYYDNPEQYERHMEETFPAGGKTQWISKYVLAKDRMERMKRAKKNVEVK